MKPSALTLEAGRKAVRLASFALALAAASVPSANAQKSEAAAAVVPTPHSDITYSTITDSNNSVHLSRVPTVDAKNVIRYFDVELLFDTDAQGDLTLASGYPQVTPSSSYVTNGFRAGTYLGPSTAAGGKAIFNVSGPALLSGGGTAWSLSLASGASGDTAPNTAVWYVEPIASNPLAARIKAAGITSTQYSFGVGGDGLWPNFYWPGNSLLGFMQVGNTLTISDFTDNNGNDYSLPVTEITYTIK